MPWQNMQEVVICSLIAASIGTGSIMAADRPTGKKFTTRSEVIAPHGMVATSQPLAAQIGIDILKSGGNAIDAAIAVNAALGLMEPTSNGIGGDLFAIIWDAETQALYGLNASGRSPQSLTLKYFQKNGYEKIPPYGPLPVTVPGCVDGWFELHNRFGDLPMREILQPTISYARNGFPVSEVIAYYWQYGVRQLSKYENFSDIFTIDGRAPEKGEIFKNPYLANTLEIIADHGRDAFYKGKIAEKIAEYMDRNGGFLSYEDLAAHQSEWVDPVSTDYRGFTVWELPPNGQGIAALQMLNILEGFNLAVQGFGSPEYIHYFVEAKKLAFEDRAKFYADPEFNDIPVKHLISQSYAKERRELINPRKASNKLPAGDPGKENGDTIYLTVADSSGNMVSLIQSNYRGMGSGMTPDSLGFVLQDRGELFNLNPDHFNAYAPGKRPFHTIIPGFVTKDGKPYMSFGVMGGSMQPQGHVQILVNMIDFGMNLQEAGDSPRIRHIGSSQPTGEQMTDGGTVYLESGFAGSTIQALKELGHSIDLSSVSFGGYQAILWDNEEKVYYGASESRKDGCAIGY